MKKSILKLLFSLIVLLPIQLYSQSGDLDPSFGIDGIAMYDLIGDMHETAYDMEILDDGSILLAGIIVVDAQFTTHALLLKLNPDGSIQTEWGNNGMVTLDLGAAGEDTYAKKIEPLSNGDFLISGATYLSLSNSEFFVAKVNAEGVLVEDFGTNGTFIGSHSSGYDDAYCMAVQEDGKIVIAGNTGYGSDSDMLFMRLHENGTLDNSFGYFGYSEINSSISFEKVNGIEIASNGNIVGAGYSYRSDPYWQEIASIVMLDPSGNLVNAFGENGVLFPEWATSYSYANDVEILEDEIYITGWIMPGYQQVFLSKMDMDGNLDSSFGTNGVTYFTLNIKSNAFDLYFGFDNKIYLCGNTGLLGAGAPKDILVLRYQMDGNVDSTLNETGYITTEVRVDSDAAFSVKLQDDGKIVVAGMSSGLTTNQQNNIVAIRYLNELGINANFTANETEICINQTVEFTDDSFGDIISWEWNFEEGDPETSTEQNPTVVYETVGLFDVELTVFDGVNYNTLLMEDYILVDDCIGLEENSISSISLYPNPCEDILTLEFASNANETTMVSILDLTGRVIWKSNNYESTGMMHIDMSSFNNGVYILEVLNHQNVTTTKRFVKE
jgi:uncharacterized delta-60 repeat protein